MTRSLFLLLVLLVPASATWAQKVEVESFVLDNGMEFLLLPRQEEPNTVVAGWMARVGSVNERPGITGLSHFVEHMMFKGTSTVGTRDPKADADFAAQQHAVRGQLRDLHLSVQYARYKKGEIDDPWDPANDTEKMAELRAKLKELMDSHAEAIVSNEFDKLYATEGGQRMNAFTSYDLTFYFISVPSNKMELWAWMESDRLSDSVFREFYAEREVVHEERRLRVEATPTGIFSQQFDAMFWQSSPYSWPIIGWADDINNYTFEQAQDFYNTYYRPNNLVGVIVGDFNPATVKPLVTKYFGRLEKGKSPPAVVTREVAQMAEKRMYAEGDVPPQVQVRYHTVPFGHQDEAALEMMSGILNGPTGRLYRSMIEGQEIASTAGVGQDVRKYAGAYSFSATCKGESTPEQLEKAWYAEIKKLQEELVAADELQKVKNRALADSIRSLESNFFLLVQLGYYEALGNWEYINTAPQRMQEVTPGDIMRVAKKYFDRENRSVAVYTRKDGLPQEAEDPEIAGLDPQIQARVKQAVKSIAANENVEELQMMLTNLEQQLQGDVPPQFRPALDLMVRRVRDRISDLNNAGK